MAVFITVFPVPFPVPCGAGFVNLKPASVLVQSHHYFLVSAQISSCAFFVISDYTYLHHHPIIKFPYSNLT
jgi:hypothetical protein